MTNPIRPVLCSTLASFLVAGAGHAAEASPREHLLFTSGWRFQKGDPAGVGDSLKYDKLKPWLLPTANAFITTHPASRPRGGAPGEKTAYTQTSFNDSAWRPLNLPHDWGVEGDFDQKLPGESGKLPWSGVAWYRKTFDLPATDHGRQIYLEIDGTMTAWPLSCRR